MTIPASINTPSRIIQLAMQDAGLLQQGDTPNSEDYAEHMGRLNDMVNLWQTQGLKLWLNQDFPVTLIAGTPTYFFGPPSPKPLRVIQAYYADQFLNRRPLIALSRDEYTRLSQVTQLGQINSYFVDKQQITLNVTFWLTPDVEAATGVAHLIRQEQVTNMVSLNDQMNFPQEWFIALRWGLADEICTGQPQAIMDRCASKAGAYRTALEDWDVEDASTSFQVDQRTVQDRGRFR